MKAEVNRKVAMKTVWFVSTIACAVVLLMVSIVRFSKANDSKSKKANLLVGGETLLLGASAFLPEDWRWVSMLLMVWIIIQVSDRR